MTMQIQQQLFCYYVLLFLLLLSVTNTIGFTSAWSFASSTWRPNNEKDVMIQRSSFLANDDAIDTDIEVDVGTITASSATMRLSSRRQLVTSVGTTLLLWPSSVRVAYATTTSDGDASRLIVSVDEYRNRDRKNNKSALVREDYWFLMGKTPPRALESSLAQSDNPEFNAFGACATSDNGTTNSCTYVSLQQRIPTYSKYAFTIGLGSKEYALLGQALRDHNGTEAQHYVQPQSPALDALLKMLLLASGLLTSPTYTGLSKRLLVGRYYTNEVGFAIHEIQAALLLLEDDNNDDGDDDNNHKYDYPRALAAWEYGKDAWNSYYQIVNDSISAKVGDKFMLIP